MNLDFIEGSGIYCFENIVNGKKYIGQADNLKHRTGHHRSFLRGGYDGCTALQNSWNKYGEENFKIYVVEECIVELLSDKEIYWIKELHTHVSENGLNISWGGDAFMRGRNHTEESKKKISENSSDRIGENNPQYGKPRTEDERDKISQGLLNYYKTHADKKIGTKQPQDVIEKRMKNIRGKSRLEITKNNISKGNVGIKRANYGSSIYVGVSLNKKTGKWMSRISFLGKKIHIGTFEEEKDAAIAYNLKAFELCGKYPNQID